MKLKKKSGDNNKIAWWMSYRQGVNGNKLREDRVGLYEATKNRCELKRKVPGVWGGQHQSYFNPGK